MKLYIAIPSYGSQITTPCVCSLMTLAAGLQARNIGCELGTFSGCSLVQVARNRLVSMFLKTDATHLLFVDADTEFRPEDVLAMIDADKPVVVAQPPQKEYDWSRIRQAALRGERDVEAHGLTYRLNFDYSKEPDNDCVPLLHAGAALMLICRDVIERVIEHERAKARRAKDALQRLIDAASNTEPDARDWGEAVRVQTRLAADYRDHQTGEPQSAVFDCILCEAGYFGEDFVFCERVREIGETVWLYTPAKLGHVGMHVFRGPTDALGSGS